MDIAVIGLGKLGLPSACCFAAAKHTRNEVMGIDLNREFVAALNAGRNPIQEPGLDELLEEARPRIRFSTDFDDIPKHTQVYLIIVPTPSGDDDRFVNDFVCAAMERLGSLLQQQVQSGQFPVVDVVSTVMPATCQEVFKPLLEDLTGGVCGIDFGLAYGPEFIALGSVVANFQNPDMILVGESDKRTGLVVQELYEGLLGWGRQPDGTANKRIRRMSLLDAEITKLSINCTLSMKISVGNFFALLCEQYAGADVDQIAAAVGYDSRIGKKLLKAGVGFGGPCLPRDVRALRTVIPDEYEAFTMQPLVNQWVRNVIVGNVCDRVPPKAKIALLGMAYKPGTHVTDDSESFLIADMLKEAGHTVTWADPLVPQEAYTDAGKAGSPARACVDADAILILTQDAVWNELPWEIVTDMTQEKLVVVDCWRALRARKWRSGVTYWALGLNLNRD
jgi:UDPglucose 6-dehydrogenase